VSGGLYNLVMGDGDEGRRGILCAAMLKLDSLGEFGRFRDAWVERDGEDLRYAIYTRNGGGNRPDYQEVTDRLRAHELYLADFDDEFDSTYATYYFRIPDAPPAHMVEANGEWIAEWPRVLEAFARGAVDPVDMSEKWQEALDKMNTEGPTPEQAAAFAPIGEALKAALIPKEEQ